MKIQKFQNAGLVPIIKRSIASGLKHVYTSPIAKEFVLNEAAVRPLLIEAQNYKQSQGYRDLVKRASMESEKLGFGSFPETLFYGTEKDFPTINIDNLPFGELGNYKLQYNILNIDPNQLRKRELIGIPLHEAFHWQRIGQPNLSTPKYNAWAKAVDAGEYTADLWNNFEMDPYEQYLFKARQVADNYLKWKINNVLHDSAPKYLTSPGELQVNGLEAGQMLDLNYFAPYPGYNVAKDAIKSAKKYNAYLKDIKSNTEKQTQDFWKILTGNYIPSIVPIIGFGLTQIPQKEK